MYFIKVSDTKVIKSMEEYIKLIEKEKKQIDTQTIDFRFNELIIEDIEENYRRLSTTFDSKKLAKEAANKFRLKEELNDSANQNGTLSNQNKNVGFEEIQIDFENISTTEHDPKVKDSTTIEKEDQMIFNSGSKTPKDFRVNSASVPARIYIPSYQSSSIKSRGSAGIVGEIDSDDSFFISEQSHRNHHNLKQNETFSKLLLINEKDEFFENWNNFYSNDFVEAFESLYKEYNATINKNKKLGHGFGEPITLVKNKNNGGVNENLLFRFIKDFDVNLFKGYNNTYSKVYEDTSIKADLLKIS